ncbi:hypothetical protein ACIPL1_09035 [Pseudomonas sp. NPDC090202]|uniref:hypothetical protein n=1 Tax=unclassified Pseudomonas TaxID=196821 RepID=UPI00381C8162
MKRTALTGLFLTAALLGSPVFAADDLCGTNLQILKDAQASSATNLSPEKKEEIANSWKAGDAAQKAGDDKKCIAETSKTISELKTMGSGSEGAK